MAKHHRPGDVKSGLGFGHIVGRGIIWGGAFLVGFLGYLIVLHAVHLMMGEVWL